MENSMRAILTTAELQPNYDDRVGLFSYDLLLKAVVNIPALYNKVVAAGKSPASTYVGNYAALTASPAKTLKDLYDDGIEDLEINCTADTAAPEALFITVVKF